MTAFDTSQEFILENDRVLLRPLVESDYAHLEHFAIEEPEIWKYSLVPANSRPALNDYIAGALKARAAGTEYPFIVFDKIANTYAGSTRFYDIQNQWDYMQLGYTWYGKAFQGTGLNKHCKFLLLQFAFDTLGMERVEFRADNRNARSIAAMKSIGCTEEGVLRNHLPMHSGGRRDSIVLSIVKGDWEGEVREKLRGSLGPPALGELPAE